VVFKISLGSHNHLRPELYGASLRL
jgi:hypothetical protein